MGVPQNGWFMREIPMKMNDLGVPLFTLILGHHHMNGNNEHNEDIRGLYKQQMGSYDDIKESRPCL